MSYSIRYSPVALRDLDRVWAEVLEASQSQETAEQYVNGLMDCIAEKKEFPRSASPLYYEGSFTGYYFVVFKAYMAFYQVREHSVLVDRVVYRKSDYMRTIFRKSNQ
jgi:toxin ParE1/3/4